MGNELVVGVLAAVLRLKDEMSGTLAGVQQRLGTFGDTATNAARGLATAFGAQQVQQALAGVSDGIGHMVESASKIADMAGRMGITAEAVQRLGFAAQQGGASISNVATAMKLMSDHITDGKLPQGLLDMGISLDRLRAMTPDQAFLTIAEAIQRIPDPMRQSAIAADVFGRSAQTLLPAIRDGFTQVAATAPVMSNATVAAGDAIGDKWNEVQTRVNDLRANAMLPLLDVFMKMPPAAQSFVGITLELLPVISNLGIAILAVGGPAAAFGMLASAMTTVASFIGATLVPAIGALLPVIGVGGLIVAGLVAVYEAWQHWDQISAFVKGVYDAVKLWLLDKFESIKTTLVADLSAISTRFLNFKNEAVIYAQQLYTGVKQWLIDQFTGIVSGIKQKIDTVTGYFADMYDKVVGHSYVPDMINAIDQQFNRLPNVMGTPTIAATNNVANLFQGLMQKLGSLIQTHIPQLFGGGDGGGGLFGSLVKLGLGALFGPAGPLVGLVSAGLSALGGLAMRGVSALWNGIKGLFQSEESKYVNGPRDAFFAQFGGFEGLARTLTDATNGDTAQALIAQLYGASTKAAYDAAIAAINAALGGAIAGASAAGRSGGEKPEAGDTTFDGTRSANTGINGGGLPGFAGGTGGRYLDFGGGTQVVLHGRERVMTESEGRGDSGINITVNVSGGTIIGSSDEFQASVTAAVLKGLEKGGSNMTRFRILSAQAAY